MPTPIMVDIDVAQAEGYTQRSDPEAIHPARVTSMRTTLAGLPNSLDAHAFKASIYYKVI
jgi:hypothetical protein